MALKVLMLRKKRDNLTKQLETLRNSVNFEKREAELQTAVEELTEESTQEEQDAVNEAVEAFEKEKEEHQEKVDDLEKQIKDVEEEIAKEEEKQPQDKKEEKEERKEDKKMNTRKFYGMNTQERDAFFANEQLKDFLSEVRTAIKEKRAITNAGLTIPSVVLPLLKEAIAANSKLLKYVRVQHVSGTSRQTIMGDVPEGIWTEMCATLNELTLAFNGVEVDGYKVGGYFAICNALVEDSDEDLVQEIIEKLGQAIGLALDKAIVYGKGTKMPLGFVTRLAQSAAPSNYPATARAWKDLSKTNIITGTGKSGLALLKELVLNTKVVNTKYSKTGIVWIMNRSTHITLLAESMDKNLNAVIVAGMNNEMPVVGGAIEELDFMEDGDIAFGYMDNYLLAERAGTAIGQSEHAKFIEDQMVLKGTARYDGTPAIAEAFALMSIGTTAPKTTVDFAADKANAA